MTDSSSFSSLLALVDHHLSTTEVKNNNSVKQVGSIISPFSSLSLNDPQRISQSETNIPSSPAIKFPIAQCQSGDNSIQNVLYEQVVNMLKVKQQEEESKILEKEMTELQLEENEDNYEIDLLKAIENSKLSEAHMQPIKVISNSSSLESLFEPTFIDCDEESEESITHEQSLPCIIDKSYILKSTPNIGKCSAFAKVLCARYSQRAPPYVRRNKEIESNIIRFKFDTKSPCDLAKEKKRHHMNRTTHDRSVEKFKPFVLRL